MVKVSISLETLIEANSQISDVDLIAVGQPICIPVPPVPPNGAIYTTGPVSSDPNEQAFVGILVENAGPEPISITYRIFDKDFCPKVHYCRCHYHNPLLL